MADPALSTERLTLLDDLLIRAKRKGAEACDAVAFDSWSLSCACRLGKTEEIIRAEETVIGLRVLIGRRQASLSSSDLGAPALDALIDRAIAMAREAPEDPWCGLAPEEAITTGPFDPDLCDSVRPEAEALIGRALAAEDAARGVEGITNSEGAEAGWSRTAVALAASNGFSGAYQTSRHSLAASVLAGSGTGMERDSAWHSACFQSDLDTPEQIGLRAARRAVARLHPRKAKTGTVPVLFDARVSGSLLRSLAGALSGPAIARRSSFLKDAMGERILPEGVNVIDDPLRARGLRSRPFDAEGIAPARLALVENGLLKSWILDCASARQLKLADGGLISTGHASRGAVGPPSPAPSNLYLEAGRQSRDTLIGEIAQGFLVTELMGMGVNPVTGDYSRGAAGFWIENGAITHPVSEVTIAGNLRAMFLNLAAADDLEFRHGIDAPTLRIDGMMVAGQ